MFEIVVVFGVFGFFVFGDVGMDYVGFVQLGVQFIDQCGVFVLVFYQDCVCVFQCGFGVGYIFVGVDEGSCECLWVLCWVSQQVIG